MQKQVKSAIILILAVFALLVVMASLTNAIPSLETVHPMFFALSALAFIASIIFWLVPWALLLRNSKTGFGHTILIGFGCVFAALTPVQVGADALRSVKMKEISSLPYSESIAASMVVKGIKFLIIAVVAALAFSVAFFNPALGLLVKAALLSGFAIVVFAALLFLLPLNPGIGKKIAALFNYLSRFFTLFKKVSEYFLKYSSYLQKIQKRTLVFVFVFALLSLLLELVAFFLAFISTGIVIPLGSVAALFSILVILERTPFLPRGLGVVEVAGFILLSTEGFMGVALAPSEIAAVIIVFDVVRLIIPAIASLVVFFALSSKKRL